MMEPIPKSSKLLHASCVAIGTSGVLIIGASGSGKSALVLELMSRGAMLVADDQTILKTTDGGVTATCPKPIAGMIEARYVGLLAAEFQASAHVRLVVDLDQKEADRLPPFRKIDLLGHSIPLLHTPDVTHFPAAIIQLLKGGRNA